MADIELVIKIPEEMYDWLYNGFLDEDDAERLWQVVKNVTPLTKGVCNIKNAEWLEHHYQTRFYVKCSNCKTLHDEESNYCPYCGAKMVKSWENEDKYEI